MGHNCQTMPGGPSSPILIVSDSSDSDNELVTDLAARMKRQREQQEEEQLQQQDHMSDDPQYDDESLSKRQRTGEPVLARGQTRSNGEVMRKRHDEFMRRSKEEGRCPTDTNVPRFFWNELERDPQLQELLRWVLEEGPGVAVN